MSAKLTGKLVVFLALGALSAVTLASEGSAAAGKAKSAMCAGCHGPEGNGVAAMPAYPKLAGQWPGYLATQLTAFRSGVRKDPTMQGMAAALSESDIKNLAAYYAEQKPVAGAATNKAVAEQGERLYRGGNAKMNIPACMSCHGPSGLGIPPEFPRVSYQNAAYMQKQLLAYKSGQRTGRNEIMSTIAFRMSEQQIEAVAQYMAGLHEQK